MTTKKYDIVAVTGTYQKDGETKKRYQTVGVVLDGEHGPYILLERWFSPAGLPNPDGRATVLLNLFAPKQDKDGGVPVEQPARAEEKGNEIPF